MTRKKPVIGDIVYLCSDSGLMKKTFVIHGIEIDSGGSPRDDSFLTLDLVTGKPYPVRRWVFEPKSNYRWKVLA